MSRKDLLPEKFVFDVVKNPKYGNGKAALPNRKANASFRLDCYISQVQISLEFRQDILDWFKINEYRLSQFKESFPDFEVLEVTKDKQVVIRVPRRSIALNVSEVAKGLWPSTSVTRVNKKDFTLLFVPFNERSEEDLPIV